MPRWIIDRRLHEVGGMHGFDVEPVLLVGTIQWIYGGATLPEQPERLRLPKNEDCIFVCLAVDVAEKVDGVFSCDSLREGAKVHLCVAARIRNCEQKHQRGIGNSLLQLWPG